MSLPKILADFTQNDIHSMKSYLLQIFEMTEAFRTILYQNGSLGGPDLCRTSRMFFFPWHRFVAMVCFEIGSILFSFVKFKQGTQSFPNLWSPVSRILFPY